MKDLREILEDHLSSGVYALRSDYPLDEMDRLIADRGLAIFHLNGASIREKGQFLAACAKTLEFPDYFGHNWDALEDCLTDLSWHTASGFVIVHHGFGNFADHSPDEAATALDILHDVAEFWRGQEKTFLVLLTGEVGHGSEMPVVSF